MNLNTIGWTGERLKQGTQNDKGRTVDGGVESRSNKSVYLTVKDKNSMTIMSKHDSHGSLVCPQ